MRVLSSSLTGLASILISATVALAQPSLPEPTVAPGDTLNVTVLSRPELSGDFTIRHDGTIPMHFLDDLTVTGLTPVEIDRRIEQRLEQQTSLPASITVQVSTWRPVYVAGDVVAPGHHAFKAGLTVAQAVSLSQGPFPRLGEAQGSSVELRIASERAEIIRRRMVLADLHARRIRLEAELAERTDLRADAALREAAGELADGLIAIQTEILASRASEESTELNRASEQADLAQTEAEALVEQQRILREQTESSQSALARSEELLERGLTNAGTVLDLRRSLNYENVQLMQAISFEARARQSMADAQSAMKLQEIRRNIEIQSNLYETRIAIETTLAAIRASETVISQVLPLAASRDLEPATLAPPHFRIRRWDAHGSIEVFLADLDTYLLPGDVLEVRRGGWIGSVAID